MPFMLGFNRRFDPNFVALKAQLDAGAIGVVELVTILSRDPGLPPLDYIKVSGGIFRDMMIHDFDMARFLIGEEFISVSAKGAVLVDPQVGAAGDLDTAVATLQSASGKLVSITNSRRATYGYDQRIEVHGTKGMLQAENVRESTVILSTEAGVRLEKPLHFFLERYAQAYANEIDAFVRLVVDGDKSVPSASDGLKALEIGRTSAGEQQGMTGGLFGLSSHPPQSISNVGKLLTIRLVSRLTVITRWNSSRGYLGLPMVSRA